MTRYINTAGDLPGDTAFTAAGTAPTLVTSPPAHRGTHCYKFTGNAQASRADNVGYSSTSFVAEPHFLVESYPNEEQRLIELLASVFVARITIMPTTGKIRLYDAGNVLKWTSTGSVPLNAWWRVTLIGTPGTTTTNGTLRAYLWTDPESNTTTDFFVGNANQNAGTLPITTYRRGKVTTAGTYSVHVDDDRWDDATSAVIGPEVAVNAIPTATISCDKTSIEPGEPFVLTFGSSDTDGTIASGTVTQTAGPAVALSGATPLSTNGATRTGVGPATLDGSPLTFSFTVTDNAGAVSPAVTTTVNVMKSTMRIKMGDGTFRALMSYRN